MRILGKTRWKTNGENHFLHFKRGKGSSAGFGGALADNAPAAGGEDPREKEAGSTLPVAICVSLILVALLALAFDFGAQLVVAERNNSDLQVCRETLSQTASGFLVKNSSDPGREIAEEVADSLRDQSYTGAFAVYVAEAPKDYYWMGNRLASTRRLIAVKIIMLDNSTAMFSRFSGVDTLPVHTDMTFCISPYSAYEAWRPSSGTNVTYSSYYCFAGTSRSVTKGGIENIDANSGYNTSKIQEELVNELKQTLPSVTK